MDYSAHDGTSKAPYTLYDTSSTSASLTYRHSWRQLTVRLAELARRGAPREGIASPPNNASRLHICFAHHVRRGNVCALSCATGRCPRPLESGCAVPQNQTCTCKHRACMCVRNPAREAPHSSGVLWCDRLCATRFALHKAASSERCIAHTYADVQRTVFSQYYCQRILRG